MTNYLPPQPDPGGRLTGSPEADSLGREDFSREGRWLRNQGVAGRAWLVALIHQPAPSHTAAEGGTGDA